jgi:hypothetical protein
MGSRWGILAQSARCAAKPLLGILVAGTVAGVGTSANASQATVIQISAMLASKDQTDFDPRLAALKQELRGLPFKGYTLLGVQSCRLEVGDQCEMDIPGGGYLHVSATECTTRHLKIRLLLNQQNRPILNADIKLNRNAGILLKSARTDMGTIILSIKSSPPPQSDETVAAPPH